MRAGDLQPVRLEIVDQRLAEAAFLAQRLLGAGRGWAGIDIVILVIGSRGEGFVAVVIGLYVELAVVGAPRTAVRSTRP